MDRWYDPKKLDAMGFDEREWNKTVELLDNPNISEEERERILEKYVDSFFKKMGAKF